MAMEKQIGEKTVKLWKMGDPSYSHNIGKRRPILTNSNP